MSAGRHDDVDLGALLGMHEGGGGRIVGPDLPGVAVGADLREATLGLTNSAPIDSTCSATSGRTSVADHGAEAAGGADRGEPGDPAPEMKTFAGGTLPAAVTRPVKNEPNSCAASRTAR